MPIEIKVLHDGVGILCFCHGTVAGKDFIETNKRILALNGHLKRVRYGMIDETGIDAISLADSDMLTIAVQNKKIARLVPSGAIVAVIAESVIALGLARTWESFIEHTGWETVTFSSRQKAELWIKERVKASCGIDLIF